MRPFLTIVTRTCRRPEMLTGCIKSVLNQYCHDLEQIFIVDRVGDHEHGNILWANRQFAKCGHRIDGRYVFALDDDGVLADPRFVDRARALAVATDWPQVILVRSISLDGKKRNVALPPKAIWDLDWENGERPHKWNGHGYNVVVRGDTWLHHAPVYATVAHGGDWHFFTALMNSGARFAKLDGRIRSARSLQRGKGNKFEKCYPGWFEQVAKQFGIVNLGDDDWRLQPWRE